MKKADPTSFQSLSDGSENMNPDDIKFWDLVAEDLRTHEGKVFAQGFLALFTHRFGNWRMGIKFRVLRFPFTLVYKVLFRFSEYFCGISLPYNIPVGRRVCLEHFGGMILIARSIGNDVTIRQNTTFGIVSKARKGWPTIENGVDIGVGAVIVGEITIGEGSVIGANAVVTQSIPPQVTAAGIPAKIVKHHIDGKS